MPARSLPPRPSLQHLKYQALDLLKACKGGDPDAIARVGTGSSLSLADAQLVIAREYGFASWPKLKRHIEALAAQPMVALGQASVVPRRESPYKQRIRQLADRILESAASGAITQVLEYLVIPGRDILA